MKKSFFVVFALICFVLLSACSSGNSGKDLFSFCGNKNYLSPNNVLVSQAQNQSSGLDKYWYKEANFYHIWVKSFYDSDGDGCGDFRGIEQKLDYINSVLGCDAIWLSPIFECGYKGKGENHNMHGYDTVDYYSVNSFFGTDADLISLINACHSRGMKIIFDFVPNHSSDAHPWFSDSAAGQNGKKDWYLWSDKKLIWDPGMGSSDTWHKKFNSYYYGAFWSGMPDLNFRNYEVREEMKNVARYWLNKGFDGIRVDAVRYIVETPIKFADTDETHEWIKELRRDVIDAYESPKFMIGEAWIEKNRNALNTYFGNGDEFNMLLDFDQGRKDTTSAHFGRSFFGNGIFKNPTKETGYGTFLANHDIYQKRLGSLLPDADKAKIATAVSLMKPTVPFIYYGQEIMMSDGAYNGDLALRAKFDWAKAHSMEADNSSILSLNKKLLTIRKTYSKVFAFGDYKELHSDKIACLGYIIEGQDEAILCVYNFSSAALNADFSKYAFGSKTLTPLLNDTVSVVLSEDNASASISARGYGIYLLK